MYTNKIIKLLTVAFMVVLLSACQSSGDDTVKVGIVVPIEHKAMDEIVGGFKDSLQQAYGKPVQVKVANAQGDTNIQRAVIQQMRDQGYDVIAAIGKESTLMTMSMVHQQPVIGIAANISDNTRQSLKQCNLALVHDELPPTINIAFIHAVYPNMKKLVLVHSTADKAYQQAKQVTAAAKKYGMTVTVKTINALPELYSVSQSLPADAQGIFILKDHLIASGIAALAKTANTKHIPLVTSDQGTVVEGAGFALGVKERSSGEKGGKLAAEILAGKLPCKLAIAKPDKPAVFINVRALKAEQQSVAKIKQVAGKMHYHVAIVGGA